QLDAAQMVRLLCSAPPRLRTTVEGRSSAVTRLTPAFDARRLAAGQLRKEVVHEENPGRNGDHAVRSCSDDGLGRLRLPQSLDGVLHTCCKGRVGAGTSSEQGTCARRGEDVRS